MSKLLILCSALIFSLRSNAIELYPYLSIGTGYKIQEPNFVVYNNRKLHVNFGGNDSAIFEAGFETKTGLSFGIKHDSQWSTGWPFNGREEYYKTELFIAVKFGGKP